MAQRQVKKATARYADFCMAVNNAKKAWLDQQDCQSLHFYVRAERALRL